MSIKNKQICLLCVLMLYAHISLLQLICAVAFFFGFLLWLLSFELLVSFVQPHIVHYLFNLLLPLRFPFLFQFRSSCPSLDTGDTLTPHRIKLGSEEERRTDGEGKIVNKEDITLNSSLLTHSLMSQTKTKSRDMVTVNNLSI